MKNNEDRETLNVVGKSVIRPDVLDKLIGRSKYAADMVFPGMLHAVTVRAPWASMTNVSVDVSRAAAMPGVVCVATAADIPGRNIVPLVFQDQPFLVEDTVRFHGEPVALIAGETLEEARRAVEMILIKGIRQTPCIDIETALQPDAPKIYGDNNIFKTYDIKRGDVETAFQSSPFIVEATYRTPHQEHAYLEPQGMTAVPDDQGGMFITGTMQCPFYVQDAVAAILGVPTHKITVVQTATGGGFGGKEDVPSILAGHVALLAYLTRRPVRLIYSREEDIRVMSKRHPSLTHIRIAADEEGYLTAADILYTLNGGAYATLSPIVLWRGAVHAAGPYRWPAVRVHARAVATHTVPNGAFRGFGQPQVTFAIESAMDELALKLKMDPLKLRKKNMIRLGDETITGHRIQSSCGLEEVVERGAETIGWQPAGKTSAAPEKAHVRRGFGCAFSYYGVGLGAGGKHLARAGAFVQVEGDGSVRVYIGNTEMGQGARSVIGQIAAETLNAPFESVYVGRADTSRVPDAGPTVASRTTIMSGNAVRDACMTIRRSLEKAAADLMKTTLKDILLSNQRFQSKSKPDDSVTYFEAVQAAQAARLPLSASGWFVSPDTSFGENGQGDAYMTYVWSANFAEVEVDMETLEVSVKHLVACHDVGKAINPREVSGQIQGGALQGIGFALMEELHLDSDGKILNPNFSGYILPTASDAPRITPIIVEAAFESGPFGAKGIGEPPLIAVAPAIANAVADAIGTRVRSLPLKPEHILKAITENEGDLS